jgi:thiosulfate reductase cytochrome b subunit
MNHQAIGIMSHEYLSRFVMDIENAERRNDARTAFALHKNFIHYLALTEFIMKYGRDLHGRATAVDEILADMVREHLDKYENHSLSYILNEQREKLIYQAEGAGMLFSDGKLVAYSCPPELVAEVTQ